MDIWDYDNAGVTATINAAARDGTNVAFYLTGSGANNQYAGTGITYSSACAAIHLDGRIFASAKTSDTNCRFAIVPLDSIPVVS